MTMPPFTAHLVQLFAQLAQDPDAGQLHLRHLHLLAFLCERGVPTGIVVCATGTGLSRSAVTRAADRLIERGLVVRNDAPKDGRFSLLFPTDAGRALDQRVRDYIAAGSRTRTAA